MSRKPNFFIIGAPKCGTTSMAAWLGKHPQIFISTPKEPLFFNTDMNWHGVSKRADYLDLFRNVGKECRAVGEASTFYLFSQDAVRNILNFQPNARFIVMLRNSLEVAQSLHTQFRYDDMEPIKDFEQAWNCSSVNRPVGMRCTEPKVLQYKDVVSFGKQVERLFQVVNPNNVMFIFMDELKHNTLHEYQRVLDFLGVEYDGRIDFPVYNQSKIYRSKWLNHARTLVAKYCENWFPNNIKNLLLKLNYKSYKPKPLRPEFERELVDQLRGDILLLSRLVKRDLTGWLGEQHMPLTVPGINGKLQFKPINSTTRFPKDTIAGLADQVLVSGGNFLTVAICAHVLSLAEQGAFTYVLASYMALLLLNVACVFQGAAVRAPMQDHGVYRTTLARLQLLQATTLAALVGCLWLTAGSVLNWQISFEEAVLIVAFLAVQQLADFSRRSAYVFFSATRALLFSVLLYPIRIMGLLLVQPNTLNQVLTIMVVSAFVPAVFTVLTACRMRIDARAWFSSVTEHLAYSRLFIVGAPLGWLWSYLPILMLGFINGKEQAAILGSIRAVSNMANVLMEQLETQVVANWARIHHTDGKEGLEGAVFRLYKIGIVLWLIGMVTILLSGQQIVNLLLGALYAPYWKLLAIGWLAYGLYFLARIYGIKHRTIGANHVEFGGGVAGVVVAFVFGLLLIPAFGLSGAAWSYVAISAALLGAQTYYAKN